MLNLEIRRLADNTPTPVSIASLAMEVRGEFQFPREDAQASGKAGGNGADSTGPAVIVRCTDRQDVMRCLDFASRHDLLVAMRNGRNEHAAWDDCDQGIAVDLSALRTPPR
ncbi:FAD-binding protein [Azoarcus taiwanensis]|uniref:FAD-binding protein n=1 Tax=Azoarcus taiwanensis TaxID=666964 RepID=UPI0014599FA7